MKQIGDKLVTCPCCSSNACYESEFTTQEGPVKTWLCMTCGFTSNTTMTIDSEDLKQTLELTADLIKDLRQDHDGLVWFPTCITMPEKGMIFPEPLKGKKEWEWTVVKTISISNKAGNTLGYSQYAYDITGATQNQVIYPSLDPSIFEVRYPNTDIKGKVVPL